MLEQDYDLEMLKSGQTCLMELFKTHPVGKTQNAVAASC